MKSPDSIIIIDRFAPLRAHLLTMLAELNENDWTRPTAAPGWSVKDVAAHLLGGDVAILSGKRDGFRSNQEIHSHTELIELVNRLRIPSVLRTGSRGVLFLSRSDEDRRRRFLGRSGACTSLA